MILTYKKEDEDLKFMCYYSNRNVKCVLGVETKLMFNEQSFENDELISQLFILNGDDIKLKDFKNSRKNISTVVKANKTLGLISFINLVKDMLEKGNLKNYDAICNFTAVNSIDFIDVDFLMLNIKSGKISQIEEVHGMDKIFKEIVEIEKEYCICSGLRPYYLKEDLLNNVYLFVVNIKKVKLGSEHSEGMICCVSHEKGSSNDINTSDRKEIEAIRVKTPNRRIQLEGMLEIFTGLEYGKIDLKKARYGNILREFKVVDHFMTFKGKKVLVDGEYVKTTIKDGPVS